MDKFVPTRRSLALFDNPVRAVWPYLALFPPPSFRRVLRSVSVDAMKS